MCGVAKYAEIVAVKILNSEREGTLSNFIKASTTFWVIGDAKNHPDKRAVINYEDRTDICSWSRYQIKL